jgi:hypothetical protein
MTSVLFGFAWRAILMSALWLALTEVIDKVWGGETVAVTFSELLVALGAGSFLTAVGMTRNELEKRKSQK